MSTTQRLQKTLGRLLPVRQRHWRQWRLNPQKKASNKLSKGCEDNSIYPLEKLISRMITAEAAAPQEYAPTKPDTRTRHRFLTIGDLKN